MSLLKEEDNSSIPFSSLLIVAGLLCAVTGFGTCNQSVDEGRLTSIEITLKNSPEFISGKRAKSTHYRIDANEYLSSFWITEPGLSIIKDNAGLYKSFQQKQGNDKLKVTFLTSRQNRLDNPMEPVDVYGLADPEQEYFSVGMLNGANSKNAKLLFICGIALLITGLLLKIKKVSAPPAA